MMKQQYKSARSSGNRVSLLHKKAIKHGWVTPGDRILDYGGGKYESSRLYLLAHNVTSQVYDKYNRTMEHNEKVLGENYDKILCSNVLNVIAESEVRQSLIKHMVAIASVVMISIYKAPKQGATQNDRSYQLAKPLQFYVNEIVEMNLPYVTVQVIDKVILLTR